MQEPNVADTEETEDLEALTPGPALCTPRGNRRSK